ncbi:MAG TPA: hypothetical protein VMM83_04370 [Longimicrobiales bacterium]|nr:hypothetical protein [Longimicrobiales bacterium]
MSQDPEQPRLTPYELVFGADDMDDTLFPPIAEEAAARDVALHDPDNFLFLTSVGKLLRGVAGEQVAGETMRQYGRLLYHAFHFWRHGRNLLVLDPAAARALVDSPPAIDDWSLATPSPAGYLQLPRHLFWAAPAVGMRPEPADGFFWTFHDDSTAEPSLHVLLALGLRPDRPGVSVIPAEGVLDDVAHWANVAGREGGAADFESTMPGGELDRLYSLETTAEVLKLASLCFWHISAHPETLGAREQADPAADPGDPKRLPYSTLSFRRVVDG